jgi:LDH2 family malate/lactate/ureidoglycolate dehydrogenase
MSEGWVVDESGNSIINPNEALDKISADRAALTPLGGIGDETGGYKGYGYATVVEILSAALQQGAFLRMLLGKKDGKKVPIPIGHFFIAINISAFTEPANFKKTTGDILRELRASKRMPGQNRIFTAGEKEYEILTERKDKGVPFNDQLLQEYRELCVSYGLQEFLHYFE